jgi:GT2 family glycosyltransferase
MLFQPEPSSGLVNSTSIVVCTVDRPGDLEDCLKSLEPFRGAGAEVIVVNNGPRGALVEQIAQRYAARVVSEPQRGVSRARNAGIRAAQRNILAFLDDDSVADPNWLPLLVAPFHDVGVLAVAGSIFSQTLADPVSRTFDYLHRAQFPASQLIVDGNAERHSFPMRAALVGNANMAIRREAFERFGYFDTRLGRGTQIGSGEEPDLLLRILLGGAKIVVEPAARILHRHSTHRRAIRRWAFQSGCAHTAILTKHFLREPSRRGQILRYAASRLRRPPAPEAAAAEKLYLPRIPLLLGSLFGPLAFLLAGKEKPRVSPRT